MLWTLLCTAAVLVLVAAEVAGRPTIRAISKPLASAAFIATALHNGLLDHGAVGGLIVGGLVLGMVGDVFLLSDRKRLFLAGLVAFLLNHVAYVVAFGVAGVDLARAGLAALPLLAFAYGVWRWLRPHVGSMAPAVIAYILVISTMVAGSFGTDARLWQVGAVLFFVSDLAVARNRFVQPAVENRIVGLPLYYAAQLVFAWSL